MGNYIQNMNPAAVLTLLARGGLFSFALRFGISLIRDFAGHCAGHVELVNVKCGLAEGRHGCVHACIAIGRAAECCKVQGLAPSDDGDVEWKFASAVRRGILRDGKRRRRGELAAGTWRRGWLTVKEFVVLAAGKEELQRAAGNGERQRQVTKDKGWIVRF